MVSFKFIAAIQLVAILFFGGLNNEATLNEINGGHIEVVGDFLTSDTGNPDILIEEVVLSGTQNYSIRGCYRTNCSFNISNVKPGTYEVTINGTGHYQYTEIEIIE